MATNKKKDKIDIPDEETLGREHTPYEKRILKMREYRQKHKAELSKYRCEYYVNNRENIREYSRRYMKERLDNNPELRKKHNEICKENYRVKEKKEPTQEELEKKALIKENKKKLRRLLKQQAYKEQAINEREQLENDIQHIKIILENI